MTEQNPEWGSMTDHQGKPSHMRRMTLLAAVVAAGLAANEGAMLWYGIEGSNQLLIMQFLVAAFGGKVGAQILETMNLPKR